MRGAAALAVLCLMAAPGTVLAQSYAAEFAQAVERCWVIDVNSEAADIGVSLAFSMLPDGRIQPDSVHLVRASSGSKAAMERAFQSAGRVVLRCQWGGGYDLPASDYARWKVVEMTFDPHELRLE